MELAAPLIAALILGAMLFFSAVVAPLLFMRLPADTAGQFVRALFPHYYLVLGAVAVLGALLATDPTQQIVLAAIAAALLLSRFVAIPVLNRARDAALAGDTAAQTRFDRWHQATVVLNGVEIVGLIAVIALAVLSRA